jgi:hypothetical protein
MTDAELEALTVCGECTYRGVGYDPGRGLIMCGYCGDVRIGETGERLMRAEAEVERLRAALRTIDDRLNHRHQDKFWASGVDNDPDVIELRAIYRLIGPLLGKRDDDR